MNHSSLAYTSKGTGLPILFLHGFCESKEIWHPFKNAFTANYRVICVDLPGFGESASLGDKTSVDAIAEQVGQLLAELAIKPLIVGHSLGGYVMLALAAQQSDSLSGMCIFHSTAYPDNDEKKENRNKTIAYVETHGVDAFCNPFVPGLFFHKRRAELKTEIDYTLNIARKTSKESIVLTTKAMRDRQDRTEVLKNTKVPVAIIAGKEDTAATLDKNIAQAQLPAHCQLLLLAETGHMGMFERPAECTAFLKGFAESLKEAF